MSGICETSSHSESHLRLPHGFLGKLGKDEGVSWQGNGFFRWIVSLKKHDFHSVQISKKLFSEVSTRNMFFFFVFVKILFVLISGIFTIFSILFISTKRSGFFEKILPVELEKNPTLPTSPKRLLCEAKSSCSVGRWLGTPRCMGEEEIVGTM